MPSRVMSNFGVLRDRMSAPSPVRNRVESGITGNAARRCARRLACTLVIGLAVGLASSARAQSQPPTQTPTYYAAYKLNGGTASQTGQTYSASATDTSGVWVTNSGVLTLENCIITTNGDTSS